MTDKDEAVLALRAFNFGLRIAHEVYDVGNIPVAEMEESEWDVVREVAEGDRTLFSPGPMTAKYPGGADLIAEHSNQAIERDRRTARLLMEAFRDFVQDL